MSWDTRGKGLKLREKHQGEGTEGKVILKAKAVYSPS